MRLKDKVAVITGSAMGIGKATALRFAEEGAKVVVADVNLEYSQIVADEINSKYPDNGQKALAVKVDVTDIKNVQAMVEETMKTFSRIDILINNAGITKDAQLLKMTEDMFDQVIDVNLKGVYNCTQVVSKIMVEQKSGVILSTSSVVAPYGNFGQTNYVASKAGVIGMTKVWAKELGRKGIRVNAIAPGFIKTRLTEQIPEKVIEKIVAKIPLGDLGNTKDIANAFLWLASDESSYVNGHVLHVDGGTVV